MPRKNRRKLLPRKRDKTLPSVAPVEHWAMSLRRFCATHGPISIDSYYKMARQGWGPATMRVGGRTLISIEAAAAWRRERERVAEEKRLQSRKLIEQSEEYEKVTA